MNDTMIIGSMLIVGVIVSVIMSILKAKFGSLKKWKSRLVLILISLAAAGVYKLLLVTGFWGIAYTILATASTIYAFFIKK